MPLGQVRLSRVAILVLSQNGAYLPWQRRM